jgi:hypothetical protein
MRTTAASLDPHCRQMRQSSVVQWVTSSESLSKTWRVWLQVRRMTTAVFLYVLHAPAGSRWFSRSRCHCLMCDCSVPWSCGGVLRPGGCCSIAHTTVSCWPCGTLCVLTISISVLFMEKLCALILRRRLLHRLHLQLAHCAAHHRCWASGCVGWLLAHEACIWPEHRQRQALRHSQLSRH